MAMTPAGERNRLVSFVRPVVVRDESGVIGETDATGEPETIERAWAKVRFGTSQERRQAGAEGASQTATFRILSTTLLRTVAMTDQIIGVGFTWDITGKAEIDGEAREIEFTGVAAKG